jgi:endonuclease/exonuclease/phosphatase family metal-dependent hydrolase
VEFTVAAFNAHWGVGRFGRFRGVPFDVARLVQSFAADIVVVAESWRGDDGRGILDPLAEAGYEMASVQLMRLESRRDRSGTRDAAPREGVWELAVCSRFPLGERREIPLVPLRADPVGARVALAVTIDVEGTPVEVIGLHTSSKVWRLAPVRHLVSAKRHLGEERPQILAGDFNFWGPPVAVLMPGWERPVRGRTYPSHRPHSQIDHVLVRGGLEAVAGEVLAATPSDHRPVRARLRLCSPRESAAEG